MEYNEINFTEDSDYIWRQPKGGSHLTTYHIRKILLNNLNKAGIPPHFTAYSYKHAAISYLVRFGIPNNRLNKRADLNSINMNQLFRLIMQFLIR
jgi:site-specific recombinase XerD